LSKKLSFCRADHNFYPNSKKGLDNLGKDSGLGYNINICWRHNKIRDVDYHAVWDHLLVPITQEFKPEMILISSGFGAGMNCTFSFPLLLFSTLLYDPAFCTAKGDRLGKCDVTPNGFATLLRKVFFFYFYPVHCNGFLLFLLQLCSL
jgi:histone deacetylase 6